LDNREQLSTFLEAYQTYVAEVLTPSRNEVRRHLNAWRDPTYWAKLPRAERQPVPSPVQRIRTRIKRPESVVDKIYRRPDSFPLGHAAGSFEKMYDTLGARIIVYVLSQLTILDREIRSCGLFELSSTIPPVGYLSHNLINSLLPLDVVHKEKDSGYASLHYIARLANSEVLPDRRPWFEIQLRTLCEDSWGEIEHVLGYKPEKRTTFPVRSHFKIISRSLEAIDEHFNQMFKELLYLQTSPTVQETDPLNAENLPSVLSEVTLGCAQAEIDGLLKILASRGIRTVSEFRRLASERLITLIQNVYGGEEGRQPGNFEVIANLAGLIGATTQEEIIARVKSQISILHYWEHMKHDAP